MVPVYHYEEEEAKDADVVDTDIQLTTFFGYLWFISFPLFPSGGVRCMPGLHVLVSSRPSSGSWVGIV